MANILITGATGHVGHWVIKWQQSLQLGWMPVAGVRSIAEAKPFFSGMPNVELRTFDFENPNTYAPALRHIDAIFLLRPPQISDVKNKIIPFLREAKAMGIKKIVFLSVQGAEKSKVIPHHKIENAIAELGFEYVFLRPGYFMQNLTSTLLHDIKHKNKIILPAGKASFNWVDVSDIAEVAARVVANFDPYQNQRIEITGNQNHNFYYVANCMQRILQRPVQYIAVNPLCFLLKKYKDEGFAKSLVMLMLHYLPRFQCEPKLNNMVEKITGHLPETVEGFVAKNHEDFKA